MHAHNWYHLHAPVRKGAAKPYFPVHHGLLKQHAGCKIKEDAEDAEEHINVAELTLPSNTYRANG